jgi:UDP-4-amino-4,6-dideoxy-N-acetyl-beta-L-altrosamine transaminase
MTDDFIPYARQVIDERDVAAVTQTLKSDFLTTGPEVRSFEEALASYFGATEAVACSSGTTALHLICIALGLKAGDQVIVPTISFVATANAVRYCGAEVVFSDVDPVSGNVTAATIASAARRCARGMLKAIFVVHMGGARVDMDAIGSVAAELGVPIVEDACHAIGSSYFGRDGREGRVGDCANSAMASFSFHPTKTMTTGEGGAVTTRNAEYAKKLVKARSHGLVRAQAEWIEPSIGFDPATGAANPWAYEMQELGFNYRMSDINAALGRSQLAKMPEFASLRQRLAARYKVRFSRMRSAVRLAAGDIDERAVLHLMVALFNFDQLGLSRREMIERLLEFGIGTQVHYIPINRQPYYRSLSTGLHYPGAEEYYDKCLSLPFHAAMSEPDVDRVCDAVEHIVG